jgi:hypothetical protein
MKLVVFVVIAPLALAACNPSTFSGGSATGNNSMAAVPVTPDAVIVNGITYVRAGATPASVTPAASPTTAPPSTTPTVAPTSSSPLGPPAETAPSSSTNPDGSDVSDSHTG